MATLKYSVITPVYNRADKIKRCIMSVATQCFQDYEHIVVDDGSVDSSIIEIESIVKEHGLENVKLLKNSQNNGVNFVRNQAIKNAKGKYLILLDSDDYFTFNALSLIDESLKKSKTYKHYLFTIDYRASESHVPNNGTSEYAYRDWLDGCITGDFVHVVEREVLLKFPFFEEFRASEILNWLRVFRYCKSSLFTNTMIAHVDRSDLNSLSRQGKLDSTKSIKLQILFRLKYYELFGGDVLSISVKKHNNYLKKTILLQIACSNYEGAFISVNKLVEERVMAKFYRFLCLLRSGFIIRTLIFAKSKLNHS
jgi:glycosyltransferase involved in cell wall biosynthesis